MHDTLKRLAEMFVDGPDILSATPDKFYKMVCDRINAAESDGYKRGYKAGRLDARAEATANWDSY